jgi:hypothetical protein
VYKSAVREAEEMLPARSTRLVQTKITGKEIDTGRNIWDELDQQFAIGRKVKF